MADASLYAAAEGSPFPRDWNLTRLKFVAGHITSGSRDWSQYFANEGAPFIRITNLSRDGLSISQSHMQHVSPPNDSEGQRAQIKENDLLFSITAYLGSIGVADEAAAGGYVSQHIALARIVDLDVDPKWVGYCMLSTLGQEQLSGAAYGGTKIQLALEDIRNLWLPLPPVQTQREIRLILDQETSGSML